MMLSNIAISHELVAGGPIDMHTSYTLVMDFEGVTYTVSRRFKDFWKLRNELSFQIKGAIIPPLPRKSILKQFGPDIVEYRRRGLIEFLRSIARTDELCQSPLVLTFIMDPHISDFDLVCDGLHEAVAKAASDDNWLARSLQPFYSIEQEVAIPPFVTDTNRKLQLVNNYLTRMERYQHLEKTTNALVEIRRSYAEDCSVWAWHVMSLSHLDGGVGGKVWTLVSTLLTCHVLTRLNDVILLAYLLWAYKLGQAMVPIVTGRYDSKTDKDHRHTSIAVPLSPPSPPATAPSSTHNGLTLLYEESQRLVDGCEAIHDALRSQQTEQKKYIYALRDFQKRLHDMMDMTDQHACPAPEAAEERLERSRQAMESTGVAYKTSSERLLRDFPVVMDANSKRLLACLCTLAVSEADACKQRANAWLNIQGSIAALQEDGGESLSSGTPSCIPASSSQKYRKLVSTYSRETVEGETIITHITI